ncbi:hypothetical protein [Phaeovulum sp.]|jgi:hypothetical protein|uniref:hypothetical protein n=1 Tax=Phaeovulum sp. TaxID=2934796 RepID=UPI002731F6E3|nr:hypothetical protein [Phaeovulum sp.]MDP1668524.1 hypothetical protein [Phaeovulum sp.]MDP2062570.1 hypothetical protein [Phaeovulum sp.]MDP3861003.1 hypothetical protein [Phaeovulum sp.]MDZ4118807.1 hypothetical protein [Phaeovulum sp.]
MRISEIATLTASLALLLGACAKPVVRPILPEPVYNKYGDVSEAACRPQSQPYSRYYPQRLRTCEEYCLEGERPNYSTLTHVTTVPVCVPIRDDKPDDPGRQPNYPTFGNNLTHLG